MQARQCNQEDLQKALDLTNKKYNNNIKFRDASGSNSKTIGFRLGVIDSKKEGSAKSYLGRRTGSACWHVHGDFFDFLFEVCPDAFVLSLSNKITKDEGNWQDWNIGSQANPLYASDACDCNNV